MEEDDQAKVGGIDIIRAGMKARDPRTPLHIAILLAKLKGSVKARSREVRSRVWSRRTALRGRPNGEIRRPRCGLLVQTTEKSLKRRFFFGPVLLFLVWDSPYIEKVLGAEVEESGGILQVSSELLRFAVIPGTFFCQTNQCILEQLPRGFLGSVPSKVPQAGMESLWRIIPLLMAAEDQGETLPNSSLALPYYKVRFTSLSAMSITIRLHSGFL